MPRKRSRSSSAGAAPGGRVGPVPPISGATLAVAVPVAAAVAVSASVALAAPAARLPAVCSGTVAILVAVFCAVRADRHGREAADLRLLVEEQRAVLKASLAEHEAQIVRLVQDLLPGAIHLLRKGASVEDVLGGIRLDPGLPPSSETAHMAMLRSVLDAVKAEEDLRQYAQRAFVNIARRVQAIVHQQSQDLREMEDRHGGDPVVFGDLLHVDHGTALIGRLADSLAVLGGERPGRQRRQDVPLFSVLRGAMSRILDYRRVEIHSVVDVAVAGPVVEPLIHALAELLDNATRYSPPESRVHLTAVEVQAGIAVEIEDAGVGLSEPAAARAERLLAQVTVGLDLADMGETPRLGMSVIGRLAQAHGFSVSLRPSAYGGVRAVLCIPRALVNEVEDPGAAMSGRPGAAIGPGQAGKGSGSGGGNGSGNGGANGSGSRSGIGSGSGSGNGSGNGRLSADLEPDPDYLPQRRGRVAAGAVGFAAFPTSAPDHVGESSNGTVLTHQINGSHAGLGPGHGHGLDPDPVAPAHLEQRSYVPTAIPDAGHHPPRDRYRSEPGLWLTAFLDGAEGLDGPVGGGAPNPGTDPTPRKDDDQL